MDRQYYKQYYSLERNHWWFVVRSALIRQCLDMHLPKSRPLQILNIGIATGATSQMLSHFGEVISSEYDEETCRFVKEELGIEVIQASVTDLPFENDTFDLVCAFDVIEHVEEDAPGVIEMKRVCKKNGFIAITVPADMALWSQHDVINHHFRRYNLNEISDLMSKPGLSATYSGYFNTILYPPVLLVRKLKNIFTNSKKPASDFDMSLPGWTNYLLKTVFSIEKWWFGKLQMPFGVSIMWLGQKKE
ncbi:MAG: class I SAM-dependent methyltransferase [Saprospiraceae bacterium]|nr:class I SAM-dependent methyltransferase [Saprospiraceae bacterium]